MNAAKPQQPFERIFDLGTLSDAGAEIVIAPSSDDLARLAQWLDVDAVNDFAATVTLRKLSPVRFAYAADFTADIVQSCVVTLEPVFSHVAREFSRELHLNGGYRAPKVETLTLAAGDDEAPEEIGSRRFDVAGPVLEELSLAVDPYPRAPGVEFEPPTEPWDEPQSPFAVLGPLKQR
jgi:hypothetical protein